MSCDVAVSAAILLASFNPSHYFAAPKVIPAVATAPAQNPLAKEPLFASIVGQAASLRTIVQAYQKDVTGAQGVRSLKGFDGFEKKIAALSDLDMKGHLELLKRGTDCDLKCILRGISQDLPKKLDELMKANDAPAQTLALRDMYYLLNDNVEVITTPETVQSTDPA